MRFIFPHSHAFRRGRVTVEDEDAPGPKCLVEFADGVTVIADWLRDGPNLHLSIPSYRTAKGAQIAPRSWCLVRGKDGVWRSDRVL